MSALLRIRMFSLTSIVDFFQTRSLQIRLAIQRALWKSKIVETPPADEGDLTSMLDAAERQNHLRRIVK